MKRKQKLYYNTADRCCVTGRRRSDDGTLDTYTRRRCSLQSRIACLPAVVSQIFFLRRNTSRECIQRRLEKRRSIVCEDENISPGTVGKHEFGIVKQISQKYTGWWILGQKNRREDAADSGGAAVLSLESSEERDQVAKQSMTVTRQLVLQQVPRTVDPALAALASRFCNVTTAGVFTNGCFPGNGALFAR